MAHPNEPPAPSPPKDLRRFIRPGEVLAIAPQYVQSSIERGAFFWMLGNSVRPNERRGDIAVVNVFGPLEHHRGWCDSYEALEERLVDAMTGDHRPRWVRSVEWSEREWDQREKTRYDAMIYGPPQRVMMRLDSPGGSVAGLWQCCETLARLQEEHGIDITAYADEKAVSAAYALACVCRGGVFTSSSGILGSVGAISTMIDMTGADAKDGIRWELITSGAFKADGHPHVALSEGAIGRERARTMKAAGDFWSLVAKARRLSVASVKGQQAGLFMGSDGLRSGLADGILSYDRALARSAQVDTLSASGDARGMRRAAVSVLTPEALSAILAGLGVDAAVSDGVSAEYKKMTEKVEHRTSETSTDDDDEDEDEDEDDDDDDDEDEDDDDPEDDTKEKKAAARVAGLRAKLKITPKAAKVERQQIRASLADARVKLCAIRGATTRVAKTTTNALSATIQALTGKPSDAEAIGALKAIVDGNTRLAKTVKGLQSRESVGRLEALIAEGKAAHKITPGNEAGVRKMAADFGLTAVRAMLDTMTPAIAEETLAPITAGEGSEVVTLNLSKAEAKILGAMGLDMKNPKHVKAYAETKASQDAALAKAMGRAQD